MPQESNDAPQFRDLLKAWRTGRGLSQGALDERLGKTRGFIGQIETGRLKPPDKEMCDKIGEALKLPRPGDVWRAAAPERLRRFDEDLAAWHAREVEKAAGLELSGGAWRLLEAVKRVSELAGHGIYEDLARMLEELIAEHADYEPSTMARTVAAAVWNARALSPATLQAAFILYAMILEGEGVDDVQFKSPLGDLTRRVQDDIVAHGEGGRPGFNLRWAPGVEQAGRRRLKQMTEATDE